MNFDETIIQCPHCGEPVAVALDPSEGTHHEFIEDCSVCCRPIRIRIRFQELSSPSIEVERG